MTLTEAVRNLEAAQHHWEETAELNVDYLRRSLGTEEFAPAWVRDFLNGRERDAWANLTAAFQAVDTVLKTLQDH